MTSPKPCIITDCDNQTKWRGYCTKHYQSTYLPTRRESRAKQHAATISALDGYLKARRRRIERTNRLLTR